MEYRFRELLKNKAITAILSVALGVVIIIARRAALDLLVKIIGGLVLTGGVGYLAINLIRPETTDTLKTDMIIAGVTILAGIILITCAGGIVDFFPTLMGIFLILNALSHLAAAGVDKENRAVEAVLGVVTIALGVLIVLRPGFIADAIMIVIGASFVFNGLFDLFLVRKVNRPEP